MRNTIHYEWDYETVDENGDITDHNHADSLSRFTEQDRTGTLVLIRDCGNENAGLKDRTWAYVKDGLLSYHFCDSSGNPMHKVPQRFHDEFSRYLA